MNRETSLVAAATGLVAVALLAAAALPGVLADPGDEGPTRPGPVDVAEVAIAPGDVGGRTATLQVEARLRHDGPPAENVTVRFRAVDAESGLVETTETVDVGTVSDEGEFPVRANLTVRREGGYRIETVVYRDGRRIETGARELRNLQALTPEYARSDVGFTRSEVLPPVSFQVVETGEERATLRVSASLTNRGDDPSGDLRVEMILRQADSNIVAARESVPVGTIRPGRTAEATANVTVPASYNYYVDVVLWKDDVLVDSARGAANLDPTETIRVNETRREVELEVSDFESRRGGGTSTPAPERAGTVSSAPGFGVGVAVVALLAVALLTRRWSA
jgi:PGF-CTERM protein